MQRKRNKKLVKYLLIFLSLIFQCGYSAAQAIPKTVVTCTVGGCPGIPAILNSGEKLTEQAILYQTSNKPEFMRRAIMSFSPGGNGGWQTIVIDQAELADTQPIIGFGGAFTDNAAMLYQQLPSFLQQYFIDDTFSSHGIAYSLGRVPMASNDFSCRSQVQTPDLRDCSSILTLYSYADTPDMDLSHFALQPEDVVYKIPLIHAAMRAAHELKLFASPWSAPAWMKTNGSMIHGALMPGYQQLWADYFVKFLEAYQAHHISFWGVTIQNEPVENIFADTLGLQSWQTMYSTTEQEAEVVKHYLGPTLKKFGEKYGTPLRLMIHDDQITKIQDRVKMVSDPAVAQYVDGAALHWYLNLDPFYSHLDKAYKILNSAAPRQDRFILGTEACEGYLPTARGPSLGSWSRGETYGHDIIADLNHHVSGWTDWNLLLDMKGGSSWVKNYVDSPILVDLQARTYYKQPMYYYLGHFSKFIRPGARLLASKSGGPFPLEEVSFRVPAHDDLPDTIVVVVMNRDITGRKYYIKDNSIKDKPRYLNLTIPAHGIQTLIYRAS